MAAHQVGQREQSGVTHISKRGVGQKVVWWLRPGVYAKCGYAKWVRVHMRTYLASPILATTPFGSLPIHLSHVRLVNA